MPSRAATSAETRPGTNRPSGGRLRARPRQADRLSHDALRGVLHDLRQPAACISALVVSCRATLDRGERPDESLRRIDHEVQQMLALVASILEERAPGQEAASPSVAASVDEAVAYVQAVHRVDTRVVRAVGTRVRAGTSETTLRRALLNVFDNAARAAGHDGHIVVSIERLKGEIHVRVDDDGPGFGGLAAEHQVGLRSAARELSHEGGRIEISSSRRLGGARVSIVVPEAPPPETACERQGSRHATSRL